jgi:hypothetical protein
MAGDARGGRHEGDAAPVMFEPRIAKVAVGGGQGVDLLDAIVA